MSTITLPNIRVGSDLQVRVRLKDGGVAIDWSTLQNIKACIYSDAQRALAGRCSISIDAEDPTLLVCNYAANKPQYLGANRVVISVKYLGETKTYDKPAFTFVRWTDDQAGEQITIDDPDVDVEIEVEDISSSILQEAVDAAFAGAERANEAAAAAEHMVDIHTGPEGKSAYEVAVEEGYTGTEEEWLASLVGPQGPQGIQGEPGEAAGFGTASAALTEDGGNPGVTVATSGSDTAKNFAFTFKNLKGDKGDKGDQGNSGYTGAAGELEVVNNLTDGGAAKALSAEMGKTLEGEISQLEAKVTDLEGTSSDLADAIGLIPHSENLYIDGTTENTQLFTTSDGQGGVTVAYGPTHGFQITSFVFEVIPGKTLSITGKTSGNRFVIATFDHYPVAGDIPLTSFTGQGTSASLQLGQTATHLMLYVDVGSSTVNLSSMKVFYGESWVDNPSSLLGEQVETLQGDVESLQGDVTELQEKLNATVFVEYTSADITDFTVGYYLPPSATSFSQDNLSANANMCYKLFEIPETEGFGEFVHAYCGFRDNYNTYENLFFIKSNYEVISANGMLLAGKDYTIPENAKYICVCFLKNYTPFGVQVKLPPSIVGEVAEAIEEQVTESVEETVEASITESLNDYLNITRSHQERTARDFCFDQERRNPFEWKAFNKRWFAFMNDDANTNMGDYFNVCRIRRVPYCHAFILNRYNSYSFTGNDANRTNLVKCPAIGQEYSVTKAADQTYLRLYIDRQYTAGFPIKITVGNDSYTINDAENARISIGSGTSVTFTITEINGVTSGRTNFINIIATSDATDSVSSTKTWTVQEMVKNIVFDFGEILAHDTPVINMWDLKKAEDYFAKYIFDDPRKIDELLGEEHCKGAILPGGPNSDRGMNTELGQHYCCRYLLYADYYGTTPQYMIQRVSYSSVVGATTVNYETAKANALAWLSNRANGFYPLFTHSEKTPEEVGAVIDAVLESSDTICSTWRIAYESNS